MNTVHKGIAFLIPILLIYGISCHQEHTNESLDSREEVSNLPDTVQKQEIDSFIALINDSVQLQTPPFKIPFPVYNETDTIKYWLYNGKPAMAYVNLVFPDKLIWPTFYIENGELVFVRYRYWGQTYPSFALENLTYLNENKIVYCLERKMDLNPGDLPGLLRDKDFSVCSRSHADIKDDYEKYWAEIKPLLEAQTSGAN